MFSNIDWYVIHAHCAENRPGSLILNVAFALHLSKCFSSFEVDKLTHFELAISKHIKNDKCA